MRFLSPDKLDWFKKLEARDISGVVVFGDVHGPITQETVGSLSLRWDPVRAGQHELAWLSWHTRLSDFEGRDTEKAQLTAWAQQEGKGVLARFVTGDGGVGKTRLAAEIADELRKLGWAAGFADLRSPGAYFANEAGTLVLIDYPEEQREGVRTLLESLSRVETEHPIRLLFLSRQGWENWEQEIAQADGAITFFDKEPVALQPLPEIPAFKVFRNAQKHLAKERKVEPRPVDEEAFANWLSNADVHRRPLFIAAAAIHSVLHPEVSVVTLSGREAIEALAKRELARLADEGTAAGLNPDALRRLSAFAAIGGDLDGNSLKGLAEQTNLDLGLPPPNKIVDAVRRSGRMEKDAFPAPTPDIVAACMLVEVFGRNPNLAPEWLWAAIEDDVAGGLERLGRLSHDAEFVLGLLDRRISAWLEKAVDGQLERCGAVEARMRDPRLEAGLVPAAVAVWRTLLKGGVDDHRQADLWVNLSVHLGALGETTEALEAIRKSTESLRHLAAGSPARFGPDLAVSLNNLSIRLNAAGDAASALDAIREAVEMYRRLAATSPARFEPDLAQSLANLSNRLSDTGDAAGALDVIRKAVDTYRRLAAASPARFESDLARILANLSTRLSDAGDAAEALDAIREAVDIHGRLAAASPARFEPDLAQSLANLSNRLSAVGDSAGAVAASRESVEIRRRLAAASPARYAPDLAWSLSGLSDRLEEQGQTEAAIKATEEALQLMRPYAELYPESEHGRLYGVMERDLARLTGKGE